MIVITFICGVANVSTLAGTTVTQVGCTTKTGDIIILYNTSSNIEKKSTFTYIRVSDDDSKIRKEVSVEGDSSIYEEETIMGSVISTMAANIPDRSTEFVSFILPQVNLDNNKVVKFDTMAIETTVLTSFAGPSFVRGAVQSSQYFPVNCNIKKVNL